jgi:hypothetical protein
MPNTHRAVSSRAPSTHPAPPIDERAATAYIGMLIDRDTITLLRPFAIKRDMPVKVLVQTLLGVIAAEKLTDAILDDDQ